MKKFPELDPRVLTSTSARPSGASTPKRMEEGTNLVLIEPDLLDTLFRRL
jgi:hypothetical protein